MECAEAYAKLSYAERSKVGALLVSPDDRPLCCGFNGTSPGRDNECEYTETCPVCSGTGRDRYIDCKPCGGRGIITKTKAEVHHAERNLLGFANKFGIATNGCSIYVTLSPCVECAKQMEIAGIKRVVFKEPYRDLSGVEYLVLRGIQCEQL
jgi:dCMP deaminase